MFFSIRAHRNGPCGDLPREVVCPTSESLRYFAGCIAGPRGYDLGGRTQSIRRYLGLQELPQVLWLACPGLGTLPPRCVKDVADFVGESRIMRAVCRRFAAAWGH